MTGDNDQNLWLENSVKHGSGQMPPCHWPKTGVVRARYHPLPRCFNLEIRANTMKLALHRTVFNQRHGAFVIPRIWKFRPQENNCRPGREVPGTERTMCYISWLLNTGTYLWNRRPLDTLYFLFTNTLVERCRGAGWGHYSCHGDCTADNAVHPCVDGLWRKHRAAGIVGLQLAARVFLRLFLRSSFDWHAVVKYPV